MFAALFKSFGRVLKSLWRGLSVLRRTFANLIFLVILVLILSFVVADREKEFPENAALVFAPQGSIVEQESEKVLAGDLLGQPSRSETLLQDLVYAIDHARTDPRIQLMVLDLKQLGGGGLCKLQDIGAALKRFRDSGKLIVAHSEIFSQQQYYLAAHANHLYLHPMGSVFLTGYGAYRNYYKSALDKLMIRMHVFIVGTFKSALEPFIRDDMSAPAKAANLAWLSDLWHAYRADLAGLRPLAPEDIDRYIDGFADLLAENDGDSARLALNAGLVDALKTRDEVEEELVALVGRDKSGLSYKKIELEDYLKAIGPRPQVSGSSRHQIGVIVACGIILDGVQPAGRIGGDSLGDLIRDARLNPDIRALVLRLDTNGGSSFASEVVRREVELTRLAGRPVVVSMGSAAASGGYWIATAASEIWASPTTITGSIGIFGAFATFEESLAKLGVYNDGVGTNQMADAFIPTRALNPKLSAAMQQITERGYRVFLEKVADGRGMSLEAVEQIAQGRVWTGSRAQKLGLVDKLGDLEAAVESAAALAGLSDYSVIALDKPLTTREKLIRGLNRLIESRLPSRTSPASNDGLKLLREVWTDFSSLQQLNDPRGIYAYCLPCRFD